jgi:hypothetical protein
MHCECHSLVYRTLITYADKPFFDNQVRFFKNKKQVLDKVSNNQL